MHTPERYLDAVGALVLGVDQAGRIVRFNAACERTSGYRAEEVRGRQAREVMPGGPAFEKLVAGVWAGGSGGECETEWGRRQIAWTARRVEAELCVVGTGVDVTEHKRLERELLEVSGREQRRIGQDLHDGLGQHLTGIAFLSKVLEQRLTEAGRAEGEDAAKIVKLVNEAIHTARVLAKGLRPVLSNANGLMSALEQRAREVEELYGIRCRFQCDEPVPVADEAAADHLYCIVQEAVGNVLRHAGAEEIRITLGASEEAGLLLVEDDGVGIVEKEGNHSGMGLHLMGCRAKMIGGSLEVRAGTRGGTRVRCLFPIHRGSRAHDPGRYAASDTE